MRKQALKALSSFRWALPICFALAAMISVVFFAPQIFIPPSALEPADPFQTLDQAGVGQLVEWAIRAGRDTRKSLKIGVCGEHGGDPDSIELFYRARVLPWLVLQLTGDGLAVGTVLALAGIPRALFMLVGGALTDCWIWMRCPRLFSRPPMTCVLTRSTRWARSTWWPGASGTVWASWSTRAAPA